MNLPDRMRARLLPALIVLLLFWTLNLQRLSVLPTVNGDEAWQSSTAWKLAREGVFGSDMYAGYYGMEEHYYAFLPLYPATLALIFRFADGGLWQARFLSVACGALIIALTYALAYRLWHDVRLSALAGLFLLTIRWFAETPLHPTGILFLDATRLARYDVLVPVLALGTLHLFLSAQRTPRPWLYLVTGMSAGLAGLAHLYGLALLPILIVLILWQRGPRRSLHCLLVLGGAVIPWLPYFAYILGDMPDWLAQTRVYTPRFDLLNPQWYWQNVVNEGTRYAIGANSSPPLALRPGFWFVLLALPGGVLLLVKRAFFAGDMRARFIVTPLILVPIAFALFVQLKFTNYLFLLTPFAAIVFAWTFIWLWNCIAGRKRGGWARFALVTLLVMLFLETTSRVLYRDALAATTTSYEALNAQLRAIIPPGARVLGLPRFGFERDAYVYRSVHVAFGLSNPMLNEHPVPLWAALDAQRPAYILMDDDLRIYLDQDLDGNGVRFANWLAARHATRVASMHIASYGWLELWKIGG